ncbi:MAG: hypothetical protein H0W88_02355 [Parachlamydiaceae bacterium]|nr:hypothetical protein [Parachlamydiaceae bacterium]
MSFNSTYSLDANRQILENIAKFGIASPQHLHDQGIKGFSSEDQHTKLSKQIHLNASGHDSLNEPEVAHYFIKNPAAGLNQILLERPSNSTHPQYTFGVTKKTAKIASERLNNGVLFVVDPDKISDSDKKKLNKWFLLGGQQNKNKHWGEAILTGPISPSALKTAFVPENLTALFKSVFPQVECIPMQNSTIQTMYFASYALKTSVKNSVLLSLGFEDHGITCKDLECTSPDFDTTLAKYMKQFMEINKKDKKALLCHVVRLVAPSDEEFPKLGIDRLFKEIENSSVEAPPKLVEPKMVELPQATVTVVEVAKEIIATEKPVTADNSKEIEKVVLTLQDPVEPVLKKVKDDELLSNIEMLLSRSPSINYDLGGSQWKIVLNKIDIVDKPQEKDETSAKESVQQATDQPQVVVKNEVATEKTATENNIETTPQKTSLKKKDIKVVNEHCSFFPAIFFARRIKWLIIPLILMIGIFARLYSKNNQIK